MISVITRFHRWARAFRQSENGNATIEFAIMFPIFLSVFLSSFEFGIMMVRQMTLERAVDRTVRELRLGQLLNPTQDTIRDRICARASLLAECDESNLLIEMVPVNTAAFTPLATTAKCRNRNLAVPITPPTDMTTSGAENQLVVIRVCAVVTPIFPTTRLGMQLYRSELGGYALASSSAFVNEPR